MSPGLCTRQTESRSAIMRFRKMKNLFLRQSYLDSWEDYERSLKKKNFIKWDYIILTASNEDQAGTGAGRH